MPNWFELHLPSSVTNWFSKNQPAATTQMSGSPKVMQGDDSETLASIKATLGAQPIAQSRVGRVPIYPFAGPVPGIAGSYHPGSDAITLNTNMREDQMGATIRHEVAHKLLQPHLDAMEADPELAAFLPKIRQGLTGPAYGGIYANDNTRASLSEGLAYRTENPQVPGLSAEESQQFLTLALRSTDPKVRAQYQSLTGSLAK